MKIWIGILPAVLLVGCMSGQIGDVTVKIPPPGTEQAAERPLLAEVKVYDLRSPWAGGSTTKAAFGVPMGNVTFDPPEAHLVKQFLEYELTKLLREKGVVEKRVYSCDLTEFGVHTDTTPLYWDVVGQVRLVLKRGGKEYMLSGTDTRRTYAWPGESILRQVVEESLKQVAGGLNPAVEN